MKSIESSNSESNGKRKVVMKNILIFSFHAGGGHIVAAQAVTEYLKNEHNQINTITFEEVFKAVDPIGLLTFKKYTMSDFYNLFVKKKFNGLLNTLSYTTYLSYPLFAYLCKILMRSYLKKSKPHLIISVAPLLNGLIAQIAQENNIPFIVVPTDLDSKWYSCYLPQLNQKTIFTLAFDKPEIWHDIKKSGMNTLYVQVTGFPIKKTFLESKDTDAIKKEFNIAHEKSVILLLMGSQGSTATYHYYQQLSTFTMSIHLLVCLGKNEALRDSLEKMPLAQGVTVSIIGFTDRIADLMAISDMCILKPGTVSFCEALYRNIPIVADNTSNGLFWERFNLDFIKQYQLGDVVTEYQQINPLLKKWLSKSNYLATMKNNISSLDKPHFGIAINNLVTNLLKEEQS
jgi:processive 1,2-diacylglycerol beta-glucosyltransferase